MTALFQSVCDPGRPRTSPSTRPLSASAAQGRARRDRIGFFPLAPQSWPHDKIASRDDPRSNLLRGWRRRSTRELPRHAAGRSQSRFGAQRPDLRMRIARLDVTTGSVAAYGLKSRDAIRVAPAGRGRERRMTHLRIRPCGSWRLLAFLFGSIAISGASVRAADTAHPVVIELFQSQGCSSCPPANANVNALSERPDVLALSFAVTYWDRLG